MARKYSRCGRNISLIVLFSSIVLTAVPLLADNLSLPCEIKVKSPGSLSTSLEVLKDKDQQLYLVVADYSGPALPGENSIVTELKMRQPKKIFAAHIIPHDRHWSVPAWVDSLEKLPKLTQYALWQDSSGYWVVIISATGGGMITYLSGTPEGIEASANSYDSNFAPGQVPMFAMGLGDNPYKLSRDLYAFALSAMASVDPDGVIGKIREEKPYPEIFNYIGWCSWNAHYTKVTANDLLEHGKSWKDGGFPMRWMIIDDGWLSLLETDSKKKGSRSMSLANFDANPVKFPDGLAGVTEKLKEDYGITWVGVWHTLQGYWNGVALNSPVGRDYEDALLPITPEYAIPDPRDSAGEKFWDGWYSFLKKAGIDFVKTDDQSTMNQFTKDLLPVGRAYVNAQRNFQTAAQKYFDSNVINCMSMNVDTIYQWATTNVARASGDYSPLQYHNPRRHTVYSIMNSLWLSNLVYPDFDMWQSYALHAEYHAVARAISGGPVYVTDKAGREKYKYLWPLILKDGRLIKVDAPALPARKSLLSNPETEAKPLIAFAKSGSAGLLAVWNVDKFERLIKAKLSPSDVEGINGTRFAVYEYFSGKIRTLGRNQEFETLLLGWDVKLYSIVPIEHGFAPIGLTDKYVSPATVADVQQCDCTTTIRLLQGGPFLAYSERKPLSVKANGQEVSSEKISFSDKNLMIDLSDTEGEVLLDLTWK